MRITQTHQKIAQKTLCLVLSGVIAWSSVPAQALAEAVDTLSDEPLEEVVLDDESLEQVVEVETEDMLLAESEDPSIGNDGEDERPSATTGSEDADDSTAEVADDVEVEPSAPSADDVTALEDETPVEGVASSEPEGRVEQPENVEMTAASDETPEDLIATGESGTCTWTIYSDGTLVVKPTEGDEGTLEEWGNWANYNVPWYSWNDSIITARFEGHVYAPSCSCLFYECNCLKGVDLTNLDTSLTTSFEGMFGECDALKSVTVGDSFSFVDSTGECLASMPWGVWVASSDGAIYAYDDIPSCVADTYTKTDAWQPLGTCVWTVTESGEFIVKPSGHRDEGSIEALNSGPGSFYWSWDAVRAEIKSVRFLGKVHAGSCGEMFSQCTSLQSVDLTGLDTSSVTDMSYMFSGCSSLSSLDLGGVNTSSVTVMSYMFSDCASLKEVTIGKEFDFIEWEEDHGWNDPFLPSGAWVSTTNGIAYVRDDIPYGVADTYKKNDGWEASSSCVWTVTDSGELVVKPSGAHEEGTLGGFDWSGSVPWNAQRSEIVSARFEGTVHAPSCAYMFSGCSMLETVDLSNLDMSASTSMQSMFANCTSLESVSLANAGATCATTAANMFQGCTSLTSVDFTGAGLASLASMAKMFSECKSLERVDFSSCDLSHVNAIDSLFSGCASLTHVAFPQTSMPLSGAASYAFRDCASLQSVNVDVFDTSNVTSFSSMFSGCTSLTALDVSGWRTSKVLTMDYSFENCPKIETLDVSEWDTSRATTMNGMFSRCSKLCELDVSAWDTSRVTDLSRVFSECSSLTYVDVSGWNTAKATTLNGLFSGCSSLTVLDVSGFDTSRATSISSVFSGCKSVTTLDVSNWDVSKVVNMGSVFNGCTSLTSLDLSNWNNANAEEMNSFFSNCTGLTSVTFGGSITLKSEWSYLPGYDYWTKGSLSILPKDMVALTASELAGTWTKGPFNLQYSIGHIDWNNGSATLFDRDGNELVEGIDYTCVYSEPDSNGYRTITFVGMGKWKGEFNGGTVRDEVPPIALSTATITKVSNKTYTGSAIKPALTIRVGEYTLKSGTDYTVAYKNNTKVGTATITVTGKGGYSGTRSVTFKIVAASVSKATVSKVATQKWTGKAITPKPTVKVGNRTLKLNTDYTLTYKNNKNAGGTATITIKGKGNYTGTKTIKFKIGPKTGVWESTLKGWRYRYANGTYPKNAFVKIGSYTYRFNASGYLVTGWQKINGKWYYFYSAGIMATNTKVDGYYLDKNGVMK